MARRNYVTTIVCPYLFESNPKDALTWLQSNADVHIEFPLEVFSPYVIVTAQLVPPFACLPSIQHFPGSQVEEYFCKHWLRNEDPRGVFAVIQFIFLGATAAAASGSGTAFRPPFIRLCSPRFHRQQWRPCSFLGHFSFFRLLTYSFAIDYLQANFRCCFCGKKNLI